MTKVIMGFALLIGTLAICRLVNQPDYNDPEFWQGSPKAVYRPTGPGPEPTPVGGWEQFDKTRRTVEQKTERRRPLPVPTPRQQVSVEMVQVQVGGKKQTVMVLRPGDERQTRDAAMLAAVEGMVQINK
jgi:hypothetical protein